MKITTRGLAYLFIIALVVCVWCGVEWAVKLSITILFIAVVLDT